MTGFELDILPCEESICEVRVRLGPTFVDAAEAKRLLLRFRWLHDRGLCLLRHIHTKGENAESVTSLITPPVRVEIWRRSRGVVQCCSRGRVMLANAAEVVADVGDWSQ
jgi:hypothetical protein